MYVIAYSKAFHSLLEISLHHGTISDLNAAKEAWTLCNEVIEIIETRAKVGFSVSVNILVYSSRA
jgi:hypothetical protein